MTELIKSLKVTIEVKEMLRIVAAHTGEKQSAVLGRLLTQEKSRVIRQAAREQETIHEPNV